MGLKHPWSKYNIILDIIYDEGLHEMCLNNVN